MKITGVKVHTVEWERGPYHWRDEIMPSGSTARAGLLRILTDEGVEGWCRFSRRFGIEEVKYQLLGRDPMNRERIWQGFWRKAHTHLAIICFQKRLRKVCGRVCYTPRRLFF